MSPEESGHTAVINILLPSGDSNHLYARILLMEHPGQLKSAHVRHEDIGDDEVHRMGLQMIQAVLCRGRLCDSISGSLQYFPEELSGRWFIINQEDFSHQATPIIPSL